MMAKTNRTVEVSLLGDKATKLFQAAKVVVKDVARVIELHDASGAVVAAFPIDRLHCLWRREQKETDAQ